LNEAVFLFLAPFVNDKASAFPARFRFYVSAWWNVQQVKTYITATIYYQPARPNKRSYYALARLAEKRTFLGNSFEATIGRDV
jgi:hypothetical protein